MATIDLILLVPILVSAFNGYRKGILVELFGIGAFIIAIVVGFKFLNTGAIFFENYIETETIKSLSPYLSFLVIFFSTAFLVKKFGWMARKALRLTFLGTFDSLLGAALGAFIGLFGVSIMLWLVTKTGVSFPERWMLDNQFYDFSVSFAPKVISKILDWVPFGGNWIEYLNMFKEKFSTL